MFLEGRILTRKKALFFRGSKEKDSFNFIYAAFIPDASIGVFRRKYITIKTTEGSGLLNWQFLKYKNPISSLKLGSTTIKGSKFDKKDCITLSYKKYANKNLKIKVVPKKGWGVNCYMSSEKRDQNPYMEFAGSFRPTKKGCNLRIEMWDKKRNTKENVDIIFK